MKIFSSLILTTTCIIFATSSLQGQEAINLISEASCECIGDLDVNDEAEMEEAVEMCIQTAIFSNLGPIMEEFEFDLTDEEEATRIGEEIGMEVGMNLVSNCPAFMNMMMESGMMDDEDSYDIAEIEDNSMVEELSGTYLGEEVTKGGFSYLIVRDEFGEKQRLLWLSPFSGDELVSESLEGSEVSVEWEPMYIRNGKEAEYLKSKVVTKLRN